MIRSAFLNRMAFAALATALFEVRVPELVGAEVWSRPSVMTVRLRQDDGSYEYTERPVDEILEWGDAELLMRTPEPTGGRYFPDVGDCVHGGLLDGSDDWFVVTRLKRSDCTFVLRRRA